MPRKKKSARKAKPLKSKAKKQQKEPFPEAQGLVILFFAVLMFFGLISFTSEPATENVFGLIGQTLGKTLLTLFGLSGYFVCIFLGWIGWRLLFSKSLNRLPYKISLALLLVFSLSTLLSLIEDQFPALNYFIGKTFYSGLWQSKLRYHLGGAPFYYIYRDLPQFNLYNIFNTVGVAVIFSASLGASILFLAKISPKRLLDLLVKAFFKLKEKIPKKSEKPFFSGLSSPKEEQARFVKFQGGGEREEFTVRPPKPLKLRPSLSGKNDHDGTASLPFEPSVVSTRPKTKDPVIDAHEVRHEPAPAKREAALAAQSVYNGDFSKYKLPSLQLLTDPKRVDQSMLKKDLTRQAEVLEETLMSFGIEAKVGQINCGPTINSFEVHPAIGVKVQKIKTLESDIALNMEAKSIRIIAPIPGKAAVGIEIPNPQPQEVAFKDMMSAYQKSGRKYNIPVLLGKSVSGDYVMSDLTKMPHCIIAGATGSGKSVCINTLVMSILMTAKPDEIKMIMVDPKKVELTPYSSLPHLLAPVINEPEGALAALKWLVKEMESRYELLKGVGVRNIQSFNNRTVNKELEESLKIEVPEKMHYIVAIFDELADLMMVSSSDIETPIARLAQMARAVGIHLILATQRPSREVITGLIKANFPTRISFKVASRINSQIVLDETGAESLLGNGDMLFLPPGSSHMIRAQGAYVCDQDIASVVNFICEQAPPNYVIESFDSHSFKPGDPFDDDEAPARDPLYKEALDIVLSTNNASTTFLQRKLKVGYARAASLIDELEERGVVSPAEGSKARKVLINNPLESGEEEEEDFS